MRIPYLRALKATLASLKGSTDLWLVTSEYTVRAGRLCSDLTSHRWVEFSEGDPNLGLNVVACNRKHALVFGPSYEGLNEGQGALKDTYRGPMWFPAAGDEKYPALDTIEGQIPRSWTDGIFSRLELTSPFFSLWAEAYVDGEYTYSVNSGPAKWPATVVWARTLRPSLTGYACVGENGEYPLPEGSEVRRNVPVFYGSHLWAKIRDEEARVEEAPFNGDKEARVEASFDADEDEE